MIDPKVVEENFPKVVDWVTQMEKAVLQRGIPLPPENRKDAQTIGIRQIDETRILEIKDIPLPDDPILRRLAIETNLITDSTAGMTFGHGIVLKAGVRNRQLVAHELAHVMQYERFGSIAAFLKAYVPEVVFEPGYPNGPLEKEANAIAESVVKKGLI